MKLSYTKFTAKKAANTAYGSERDKELREAEAKAIEVAAKTYAAKKSTPAKADAEFEAIMEKETYCDWLGDSNYFYEVVRFKKDGRLTKDMFFCEQKHELLERNKELEPSEWEQEDRWALKAQQTYSDNGLRGRLYPLAMSYCAPFEWKGAWYMTVFHALCAVRCAYEDDAVMFEAQNGLDFMGAKNAWNYCEMRSDWEDIREERLESIVRACFEQNPECQEALLKLPEFESDVVVKNHYGDKSYGKAAVTRKGKIVRYEGDNLYGKLLSKLAAEARAEKAEQFEVVALLDWKDYGEDDDQ